MKVQHAYHVCKLALMGLGGGGSEAVNGDRLSGREANWVSICNMNNLHWPRLAILTVSCESSIKMKTTYNLSFLRPSG